MFRAKNLWMISPSFKCSKDQHLEFLQWPNPLSLDDFDGGYTSRLHEDYTQDLTDIGTHHGGGKLPASGTSQQALIISWHFFSVLSLFVPLLPLLLLVCRSPFLLTFSLSSSSPHFALLKRCIFQTFFSSPRWSTGSSHIQMDLEGVANAGVVERWVGVKYPICKFLRT